MGTTRAESRVASRVTTSERPVAGSPATPGNEGGLLDYEAAAEYLCTTPRHVRKLWETRQLAAIKVGRCVRFAVADLDAFIADNRAPAARRLSRFGNHF